MNAGMLRDYVQLAIGNIRFRQRRSLLTMVGIFIGIAAVVSLISLGQGFQDAINTQFSSIGADKVIVQAKSAGFGPPGSTSAGKLTDKDLEAVRRVPGVEQVAGRLLKTGAVRFNDRQRFQFIASLPNNEKDASLVVEANKYVAAKGRMLRPLDKGKLMVGFGLADKSMFGKAIGAGSKVEVNGRLFEVVGILGQLGDPGRNKAVVMNQDDLRSLMNLKDKELSLIVAKASPTVSPDRLARTVKRALLRLRHEKAGRESVDAQTSDQLIRSFNTILNVAQIVLVGIAFISLLVGGIGITNTMFTAVVERTREIGIMKAVGATNSGISLLFLLESGFLGMAGGIIGVVIGLGLSGLVVWIAAVAWGPNLLQASVSWTIITGAFVFSFVVGIISGSIPAWRAARLQPVEALRYE